MLQTTDGPLDAADWLVQQGLSVFLRKDGAGPVLIENQSSQHVMLQGGWNIRHRVAVGATTYSALLTPRAPLARLAGFVPYSHSIAVYYSKEALQPFTVRIVCNTL